MGKRKLFAIIFGMAMSAVLASQAVYADEAGEPPCREGLYEAEDGQQVYVLAVSPESAFVVRKGYGEEGWYTLCDVLAFDREEANRAVSVRHELFPDYIWKGDCVELRTEGGSFADGEYIWKEEIPRENQTPVRQGVYGTLADYEADQIEKCEIFVDVENEEDSPAGDESREIGRVDYVLQDTDFNETYRISDMKLVEYEDFYRAEGLQGDFCMEIRPISCGDIFGNADVACLGVKQYQWNGETGEMDEMAYRLYYSYPEEAEILVEKQESGDITDEELTELALCYYEKHYGYRPNDAGLQDNGDGTVSIQLYDNLDGHNSTCAWYTIDRLTLLGKDDNTREAVDLSEVL